MHSVFSRRTIRNIPIRFTFRTGIVFATETIVLRNPLPTPPKIFNIIPYFFSRFVRIAGFHDCYRSAMSAMHNICALFAIIHFKIALTNRAHFISFTETYIRIRYLVAYHICRSI